MRFVLQLFYFMPLAMIFKIILNLIYLILRSDISNRARVLLSRWSKMFARSQAMKKPNGLKFSVDAQDMILKQSIDEIMDNALWQANGDNPEDVLSLAESSESIRKIEPSQTLKLLPSSTDDANKKHILGGSSSNIRERRKVQYVEQPGQKTGGRSPQSSNAAPVSQGRPVSTDDIQKAKMRALFMRSKYGKTGSSSNGTNGMKSEGLNKPSSTRSSNLFLASKVPLQPMVEEHKKPVAVPPKIPNKHESPVQKHYMDSREDLEELCRTVEIPWHIPPEIKLNDLWRVGTGENSKEVDVQKNRNRREIETMYRTVQEIPSNPKEPWDIEMDYDDSLTPDIPIEQPPDADVAEAQVSYNGDTVNAVVASAPILSAIAGGSTAEPDFELLAVLLKNPELVFALTSGQAGNLSPEETVKLLDVIKRSGMGLSNSLNGFPAKAEEKVEVSLPSPTPLSNPLSNPGTSGRRPEVSKNPFSQQSLRVNRVGFVDPTTNPSTARHTGLLHTQNEANKIRIPQQQTNLQSASQQLQHPVPSFSLPQATPSSIINENRQPPMILPSHQNLQTPASAMNLPVQNFSTTQVRPSMQVETMNHVRAAPAGGFAMTSLERRQVSYSMPPSTPISAPALSYSQASYVPEPRPSTGNMVSMPESWRVRQGLASNSLPQVHQNNYNALFGGRGKPSWERNEYMGEGFESWSPENSPVRSPESIPGRNSTGPISNGGWNYNPDVRSRPRNSGANRDPNWDGIRRWR